VTAMTRNHSAASSPTSQNAAVGSQLELFQRIVPERGKVYTQSLELWDQMPRVILGRPRDQKTGKPLPKDSQYLPIQTQEFVHEDARLFVDVAPARLRMGNSDRDVLPGLREYVVEHAIRKIAIQSRACAEVATDTHGCLVGTRFRIGAVRTDLSGDRHTYSWLEIRDALLVGSGAVITLRSQADQILARAPIFPAVSLPSETEDGWAYVAFHPLVTAGIRDAIYRQLHYTMSIGLKSALARWVHRRMVHRFRQADYVQSYTILASTILRESGLCRYGRLRERLAAVDDAIEELREKNILRGPSRSSVASPSRHGLGIMEGRAWKDTKFELYASSCLIDEIKLANIAAKGRS